MCQPRAASPSTLFEPRTSELGAGLQLKRELARPKPSPKWVAKTARRSRTESDTPTYGSGDDDDGGDGDGGGADGGGGCGSGGAVVHLRTVATERERVGGKESLDAEEIPTTTSVLDVEQGSLATEQTPEVAAQPEGQRQKTRRWRPSYATLMWAFWVTVTGCWVVDRFTTQMWPRQMFSIGRGSAGSDIIDGLHPGGWTVK